MTLGPIDAVSDAVQFVSVEEGHFEPGAWVVDRRPGGDQTFFGLRLPSRGATGPAASTPLDEGANGCAA